MGKPRLDATGFSLLELIVVVTVFGMLLAAGLPMMSKFLRSSRAAGATNMLIADIHQARSLATMKQKTYQIAFGTNAYSVLQLAPLQTVHTRAMPSGVACSASDTATFFPWGLTVPVAVTVVSVHDTTVLQISANGSVSHD